MSTAHIYAAKQKHVHPRIWNWIKSLTFESYTKSDSLQQQ